jgi:hypothetical protein
MVIATAKRGQWGGSCCPVRSAACVAVKGAAGVESREGGCEAWGLNAGPWTALADETQVLDGPQAMHGC